MIQPLGGGGRLSTVHSTVQRCTDAAAQQDLRRSFPFSSSQRSSQHENRHNPGHDHFSGPRGGPGECRLCSWRHQPDRYSNERCEAPRERPCAECGAHWHPEHRCGLGPREAVAWSAVRDGFRWCWCFNGATQRCPHGSRQEAMTGPRAPELPDHPRYTLRNHVLPSPTTPPLGSANAVRVGVRYWCGDCQRVPVHLADGTRRCASSAGFGGRGRAPRWGRGFAWFACQRKRPGFLRQSERVDSNTEGLI